MNDFELTGTYDFLAGGASVPTFGRLCGRELTFEERAEYCSMNLAQVLPPRVP